MFQSRRVVSTTAYGRRRYVQILAHYLLQLRGLIDEHHFWINTDNREDLDYVQRLARQYPTFFKVVDIAEPFNKKRPVPRISKFYTGYCEPDVIYLKFDDDIVWIDEGAVERLLAFRTANPEYFAVFPNLVNNSLCSHLHQRMGILPAVPRVEYKCAGKVSWKRWQTALACHETFHRFREAGELARYAFPRWVLGDFERFSINAMCWFGHDLAPYAARIRKDDERWLTEYIPKMSGRPTCITGDSLMAHFAYFTQRNDLEANSDILTRYQTLVEQMEFGTPRRKTSGAMPRETQPQIVAEMPKSSELAAG